MGRMENDREVQESDQTERTTEIGLTRWGMTVESAETLEETPMGQVRGAEKGTALAKSTPAFLQWPLLSSRQFTQGVPFLKHLHLRHEPLALYRQHSWPL